MNTVLTELTALFESVANDREEEWINHDRIASLREQPKSDRELWIRLSLSGPEVTTACSIEFHRNKEYAADAGHEGMSLLTVKGWFTTTSVFEAFRGQLFRQHLSVRASSLFNVNEWGLVLHYSEALEIAGRLHATEHVWEREITPAHTPANESVK